ncbi:hypothetical protein BHE74_00034695 [Ensete ventricosum]|uniref:Uncharacterized protein n=1 Tax=Ensete ventricosum TaxID=4639 RepID=A0A427B438_ENSVE|nr:hypothetical protein B296_00004337 [Ensete ventricosum]RWW58440.1 hypothetical protein BHE74_00034695 [Ensete ventricosum]RZR72176.1 hypothetical protein BHM03_00011035 [Ensete ventricosum]
MGETGGEEDCAVAAGLACGSSEEAVDSSPSHMALGLPAEMMKSAAKKKPSKKSSLDEDDFLSLLHGSDPVKIELNRLHNMVKGAINLEIKRITEEKKEALAAQFAAEATLRRVHAAQKDEELPTLEDILFPLEAEIKLLRQEVCFSAWSISCIPEKCSPPFISKLQDDSRALERLTKTKEAALLDAEREVQIAKIKAALVDDLQNKNQELMKQNEINQEEYKILDRMHRQKVAEVEKLGQTVHELEEALLSGAAAANAVRDYQRQVNELKVGMQFIVHKLTHSILFSGFLQGEMQQLRDKLSIAERAAKAEAQLKVCCHPKSLWWIRYDIRSSPIGLGRSRSINGSETSSGSLSGGTGTRKPFAPIGKSSTISSPSSTLLKHAKGASKSFDGGRVIDVDDYRSKSSEDTYVHDSLEKDIASMEELSSGKPSHAMDDVRDDYVAVVFYDILQKEVITLRKSLHEKDQCLKDKDNSTEVCSTWGLLYFFGRPFSIELCFT